eukprot:gene8091-3204_t
MASPYGMQSTASPRSSSEAAMDGGDIWKALRQAGEADLWRELQLLWREQL